jgi:tryptophan 2,3-dioxygenase
VTTYWDYIRVEELLSLQRGLARDEKELGDDEVLFVTVHQVFELWFKLVLRELVSLRDLFRQVPVPEEPLADAARSLERITRIFRVAAEHWNVVETLGTRDYLAFREKLTRASGFQSAQLREIEVMLGLDDSERVGFAKDAKYLDALKTYEGGSSKAYERVKARLADRPNFKEALETWLHRTPIRGSQPGEPGDEAAVDGFLEEYLAALEASNRRQAEATGRGVRDPKAKAALDARFASETAEARAWLEPKDPHRRRIRAAILFIEGYRELPLLAWPHEILSRVVETEQGLLVFRQRHARMVERVIGRRVGTGGSGLDYLDETTKYRVFKDLWTARTFLVRADSMPPLRDPAPYEFRAAQPPM